MGQFLLRHLWMPCACLMALLVFGIILYNDWRTSPFQEKVERGVRFPCEATEDKDALWPFTEALKQANTQFLTSEAMALVPIASQVPRMPLDESYPPEQRKSLHEYALRSIEIIAQIEKGMARDYFDCDCCLWKRNLTIFGTRSKEAKCPGIEELPYQQHFGRYFWDSALDLKPVITVIGVNALDALLRDDKEGFLHNIGLIVGIAGRLQSDRILPGMLQGNLNTTFIAIDLMEEALNRLEWDNAALERMRRSLATNIYTLPRALLKAHKNRLALIWDWEQRYKVEKRWPENRFPYQSGARYFSIDRSFGDLARDWTVNPIDTQYQLYYLRAILRLGKYYVYGGVNSFVFNPAFKLLSDDVRRFAASGWSRESTHTHYFFSKEAKALLQEENELVAYYQDYEPYGALLAYARIAECALAAVQYRNEKGYLPDSLEILTPDYLKALPTDPYAPDQPLQYLKKQDQAIFYSIGPNLVDDGGARCPIIAKTPWESQEHSSRDIVFALLGRPEDRRSAAGVSTNEAKGTDL